MLQTTILAILSPECKKSILPVLWSHVYFAILTRASGVSFHLFTLSIYPIILNKIPRGKSVLAHRTGIAHNEQNMVKSVNVRIIVEATIDNIYEDGIPGIQETHHFTEMVSTLSTQ